MKVCCFVRFNSARRTVPLISSKCSDGGFLLGAPFYQFPFHTCACVSVVSLSLCLLFLPSHPSKSISGSPSRSIHLTELSSALYIFDSISSPGAESPFNPSHLIVSLGFFLLPACQPVSSILHTLFSQSTPPFKLNRPVPHTFH